MNDKIDKDFDRDFLKKKLKKNTEKGAELTGRSLQKLEINLVRIEMPSEKKI